MSGNVPIPAIAFGEKVEKCFGLHRSTNLPSGIVECEKTVDKLGALANLPVAPKKVHRDNQPATQVGGDPALGIGTWVPYSSFQGSRALSSFADPVQASTWEIFYFCALTFASSRNKAGTQTIAPNRQKW